MEPNPQVIFAWKAPLRAYKKRGGNILRFYIAVALLLSVIVFLFSDKILLIPIWAVLFLFYVLTITPPPEVDNKITQFGLETAGISLRWEVLSHFYYIQRFGFTILVVVTAPPYYFHTYMVVPTDEIKKETLKILSDHLMYQEKPNRNITDKVIDWLTRLIPDDEEKPASVSQKPQPASL